MKTYKALFISCLVIVALLAFVGKASAMTPTLYLSQNGGTDNVTINVTGDSNSSVILYYNINSNSIVQTRFLGNTNYSGSFSTTVSMNDFGVTPGGLVYVIINSQQSSSSVWPFSSTSNTLGLNVSNITLPVGSSATFSSSNSTGLYVSNNSNSNIASALSSSLTSGCNLGSQYSITTGQPCFNNNNYNSIYNNNGSVVISALSAGSSTVTLCQNSGGNTCSVVYVTVVGNYSNIPSYSTSYIPSSAIVDSNYSTIPIIYSR